MAGKGVQLTPEKKLPLYEATASYVKDIVYILLFLISAAGWLTTTISSRQAIKDTVDNNTEVMKELKNEISNINKFLLTQQQLNGQFIQFMEQSSREEALQEKLIDAKHENAINSKN